MLFALLLFPPFEPNARLLSPPVLWLWLRLRLRMRMRMNQAGPVPTIIVPPRVAVADAYVPDRSHDYHYPCQLVVVVADVPRPIRTHDYCSSDRSTQPHPRSDRRSVVVVVAPRRPTRLYRPHSSRSPSRSPAPAVVVVVVASWS